MRKVCQPSNHTTKILTIYADLPEIRRDVRIMTNEHFQTTATIAAFLSGVTATIMQFTYQFTDTPLENAVNILLFSSLLFSLMSVINSLLFIKWYKSGRYELHSMYSSCSLFTYVTQRPH